MRPSHSFIATAILLAACAGTASAQTSITKCIDEAGRISYSDGSCGQAVLVGYVDVKVPDSVANPAPAIVAPPVAPNALDNVPIHESAWATMQVPARRGSTDAATIREARLALEASDRGLAALRTQKVASSK